MDNLWITFFHQGIIHKFVCKICFKNHFNWKSVNLNFFWKTTPLITTTNSNIPTTTRTTSTIAPSTTSSSNNLPNGCLDSFRQAALNAHNTFRSKHSVKPLVQDTSLNGLDNSAQSYATQMGITNVFAHSNKPNTGENIYASYTSQSLNNAFCSSDFKFLFRVVLL